MCCLRYEDETYEELKAKLPRRNSRVRTDAGEGWVLDGQILTQLVLVQFDDGKRAAVPMEQIKEFDLPRPRLANGREMQFPGDGALPPGMERDSRPGPSGGRSNGRGAGPSAHRPPQRPRPPTNGQRSNGVPPRSNPPSPGDKQPPNGAHSPNEEK
jgi:hypothetical protein